MSDLNSLSVEAVKSFMLSKGGKVTNHELVKHFKTVLTNPETRDEARIKFKEIVNTLATITKDSEGGKQLVLRKKYRNGGETSLNLPTDLNLQYTPVYQSPTTEYPEMSRRASQDSLFASITFRSPLTSPLTPSLPGTPLSDVFLPSPGFLGAPSTPISSSAPSVPPTTPVDMQSAPFRTPTTPRDQLAPSLSAQEMPAADPPPVPPRRRSSELKLLQHSEDANSENKENVEDGKISVKERSQKFDRMASEGALHKATIHNKKRQEKADKDEEDGVTLFDAKSREWIVRCAQGDYQAIAKLAGDNPKLVKFKDPTNGYTALHWAAKHGNEDLIKLIAGTHNADVNARTNGGYTALHIAMQFGHEDVYSLLTEVYGADGNLRDWSGKKPRQYQTHKGTSVSADTFRKIKARKKHAEKDLGFLRIGSLNVRVKRTTEAFSNFLGVGSNDKIHKHWGSADNLPQGDGKKMPPPKFAPIKKRKSKRAIDFSSRGSIASEGKPMEAQDSDSDAGFGSTWQSTV